MNIINAARYLTHLSYQTGHSLTYHKLQNILFYAQSWACVWDNAVLCPNQEFKACDSGMVNETIKKTFEKYKNKEIPEHEGMIPDDITMSESETLKEVWSYCIESQFEIKEQITSERIWLDAIKSDSTITDEMIKTYFKATY